MHNCLRSRSSDDFDSSNLMSRDIQGTSQGCKPKLQSLAYEFRLCSIDNNLQGIRNIKRGGCGGSLRGWARLKGWGRSGRRNRLAGTIVEPANVVQALSAGTLRSFVILLRVARAPDAVLSWLGRARAASGRDVCGRGRAAGGRGWRGRLSRGLSGRAASSGG